MKAHLPPMSKKKIQEVKSIISAEIDEEIDGRLKDREMLAGCRAQWMLLYAVQQEFGFGKKRLMRIFRQVEKLLPYLAQARADEAMDEILINRLSDVEFDVHKLYPEYFEIIKRVRECEKLKLERAKK